MKTFKNLILLLLLLLFIACIPQNKSAQDAINIPVIKVLLAEINNADTLNFNGTYFLETEEARYEFGPSNSTIYIQVLKNGYKIYNEKRLFRFRKSDRVELVPADARATIQLNNGEYSGRFSLFSKDSLSLYFVNQIDIESYLQGVVPAGIFTTNIDYLEAIKAQAICARTYALKKMDERNQKPFHVFADVRDQVYGGVGKRTKLGDLAVLETQGSTLLYNNALANTFFHSSCGGVLEDASDVWQGPQLPYLKSQQDVIGKEFADGKSPYYRWIKERTVSQLDTMFNYTFGTTYLNKPVQDTMDIPLRMRVTERSPSGRVTRMIVNYGTDQHELKGYEIRRFLGWPGGSLLPSTLFKLSSSDTSIIIKGAGNGHGVGMCQYGAMYKAQKGLQYYHILQSYFPGTVLKRAY